jgi:Amt family ammonium transporter
VSSVAVDRRLAGLRHAEEALVGMRLDAEEEFNGADLSIHKISSTSAERETLW